jgi:hypothetical protein
MTREGDIISPEMKTKYRTLGRSITHLGAGIVLALIPGGGEEKVGYGCQEE